jgi:hypothetical protein
MGRRWTDKDIDDLRHMARRISAPKIAETMDRTVGGVTFKAHQLKLSLRPRQDRSSIDPGPSAFDWEELPEDAAWLEREGDRHR